MKIELPYREGGGGGILHGKYFLSNDFCAMIVPFPINVHNCPHVLLLCPLILEFHLLCCRNLQKNCKYLQMTCKSKVFCGPMVSQKMATRDTQPKHCLLFSKDLHIIVEDYLLN